MPPTNLPGSAPEPASFLGYHRQLAPNAAIKVSPICLGTMNFGDSWKDIMGTCDKKTSMEILDYFYNQGGNFLDTVGTIVGEWMKSRGNRDQIVMATKYTSPWRLAHELEEIQSNFGGNNKKALHLSLEASLRKLQTSYIDILYVHTWDFTTSIPELMHSLHHLIASSKVLYLGISNTPTWVVSKANEYARNNGLTPFSVYQGPWSAAERNIEREVIPMCSAEGMAIAPFSTLGSGYFKTAAQRAELATTLTDGRNNPFVDVPSKVVVAETLERIATAKETSITSVAMAYIMHKAPYVFPILGGRTTGQLNSNIQALCLKLSQDQMKEIDAAVPFDFGYPQTFLGGASGAVGPEDVWITRKFGRFDWVQKPRHIEPRENPK